MFIIIGLMLTGMLLGYLLRRKNLCRIHNVITVLIWVLLFILGVEVGGNEQIIKGLSPGFKISSFPLILSNIRPSITRLNSCPSCELK